MSDHEHIETAAPAEPVDRRRMLKVLTWAAGGIAGAVLATPLVRFLGHSMQRRVVDTLADFVSVALSSAVGAEPRRVEIAAPRRRDAWSVVRNVTLGAAWLFREPGGRLKAFSTSCPHLGCPVDYDAASDCFRCPCHSSSFARTGERLAGPAKRGLDELEARDEDGRISIRFRRFKLDVSQREEG